MLAPFLGERMIAARFLGQRDLPVRELLPQDLKIEIARLTRDWRPRKPRCSWPWTVGQGPCPADGCRATRRSWLEELQPKPLKTLDAPVLAVVNIVELIAGHEAAYLEHCRRYAMASGA